MRRLSKELLTLGLAFTSLLVNFSPTSGYAQQQKTVLSVIVAKNSPLDSLSIHELKRLFMGEYETGGTNLRLIPLAAPPRSAERIAFDEAILGMTAEQAASYWIDRKIRGESGAPKTVDSPDLLQRVVNRLDGAVGYVRASEVRDDVKVVRVDGKTPGDSAYRVVF